MGPFPRIPPVEVQAPQTWAYSKAGERVDVQALYADFSPKTHVRCFRRFYCRCFVSRLCFMVDLQAACIWSWTERKLSSSAKHHSLTSGGNFQDFMKISRPRVRRSPLRPWFVPTNSPRWRRPAAGHAQSAPRKYAGKRRTYLKTGGSTESAEELWGGGGGDAIIARTNHKHAVKRSTYLKTGGSTESSEGKRGGGEEGHGGTIIARTNHKYAVKRRTCLKTGGSTELSEGKRLAARRSNYKKSQS